MIEFGLLLLRRLLLALVVPVLRWLAIPLLIIGIIALVADGTRIMNGNGIIFTSTQEHWSRLSPQSLANAKITLQKAAPPALWDQGVQRVLGMPAFLLFGGVGGLLAYAGRRRERVNIFAN